MSEEQINFVKRIKVTVSIGKDEIVYYHTFPCEFSSDDIDEFVGNAVYDNLDIKTEEVEE